MSESMETVRRAFDAIAFEMSEDKELYSSPAHPAVTYQVAALREVAVQLARIGDLAEGSGAKEATWETLLVPVAERAAQDPGYFDELLLHIEKARCRRQSPAFARKVG